MITLDDLEQAIAECQGERNPNANTCVKLAAFYTLRNELYGKPEPQLRSMSGYSMQPAPDNVIAYSGDSEFSNAINGRTQAEIWPILDEAMSTLSVIEPRLYASILRKLGE